MITEIEKRGLIMWQEGERPIIFKRWRGSVEIQQEDRTILVDDDDIKDFVKAFNKIAASNFEDK